MYNNRNSHIIVIMGFIHESLSGRLPLSSASLPSHPDLIRNERLLDHPAIMSTSLELE